MTFEPHLCPLCGKPNECALADGRAPESCWCFTAQVTPRALERIPEEARGVACLCQACATAPQARSFVHPDVLRELLRRRARDG